MLCSAYPQVVGKVFGVVLWRLQFQLTRLVCGNSLLSRCGGSCILDAWQSGLLHHLAKVATGNGSGVRLPQHPRAVAGGKKPFFAIGFPYGGLG